MSAAAHALDFIPADAVAFVSYRPAALQEELLNSKVLSTLPPEVLVGLKPLQKQLQDLEKQLGFGIANVKRLVMVVPSAEPSKTWVAVELMKNTGVNREKLKEVFRTRKEQFYEGRQYFVSFEQGGPTLYFVDDHLFVVAEDAGMKTFLGRKVSRQGPLAAALDLAAKDGSHVVAAFAPPAETVDKMSKEWSEKWLPYRKLLEMKSATLSSSYRGKPPSRNSTSTTATRPKPGRRPR